jgi:predicted amidohydrolase
MKQLHVAAAQIHSGGPVEETLARAETQVRVAATVGAEVILFSECALHGYDYDLTPEILRQVAEPSHGPNCRRISEIAQEYDVSVLMGFFERDGETFYNSQLIARNDGSRDVERKHVLTEGETSAGLSHGPRHRKVFEFNGVRTSIIICADGSIDGLHDHLAEREVDYRFCPTAGGGKMEEMLHESDLDTAEGRSGYEENRPRVFKTEAILDEEECPNTGFTAANALGPVGKRTCHQGHCMIVDNRRVMRAQIPGTNVLEHQQDQIIHAVLTFPAR